MSGGGSSLTLRPGMPEDDAALRQLLREAPVQGGMPVTLEREPSFFEADIDVRHHDVVTAWSGGTMIGCASRVVRPVWWGGEVADAAYLADLRLHPAWQRRAGRILLAGYRHMEQCARHVPAAVTWTAVFEQNHTAQQTIAAGRAGLPSYQNRGRLHCPVLFVSKGSRVPADIKPARPSEAKEIAGFLNTRMRTRLLAPLHTAEDLCGGKRWPGLRLADILVLRKAGRITGVVAVHDVRQHRQIRVGKLTGWQAMVRPWSRLAARIIGYPGLPRDGSVLALGYASFLAVEGDDPATARKMLVGARAVAAARGLEFLCTCLHAQDPLVPALSGLPALTSHGTLYEVVAPGASSTWVPGVPHLEPVCL